MRKILVIIFTLLFLSISYGQFSTYKSNPFSNTLLLGLNGGLSIGDTDWKNNDIAPYGKANLGYYLSTNSKLFFGLHLNLELFQLKYGSENNDFTDEIVGLGPSLTGNYMLTDSFFPFIELGINNLWYSNSTEFSFTPKIGFNYLVSKFFAFNANIGFNFVNTDNLDDLIINDSQNDFYTTFSVGFSYAVDLTVKNDIDEDGILNSVDMCPELKEDYDGFEDNDGCPEFDNDDDGIVDSKDNCPNEPEDFDGYKDDDGCLDKDNDGDGILDIDDKCPDLKEDFDNFEDGDGCPELDNDKDGIIDSNDKCPNDAETINGFEDFDGCPDELPKVKTDVKTDEKINKTIKNNTKIKPSSKKTTRKIDLKNEYILPSNELFINGGTTLKNSAYPLLDEIALAMKSDSKIRWQIEGHLDNSGTQRELRKLSEEQALAVKSYLVAKGLPARSLKTIGLADHSPIAPNSTIQGKLKNRRIVIKRIR